MFQKIRIRIENVEFSMKILGINKGDLTGVTKKIKQWETTLKQLKEIANWPCGHCSFFTIPKNIHLYEVVKRKSPFKTQAINLFFVNLTIHLYYGNRL